MASTNVATPPRVGLFDLCSFLIAVDIEIDFRFQIQNFKLLSLIPTKYFWTKRWWHDVVIKDSVSRLLSVGHGRRFSPRDILVQFAVDVRRYLLEFFARRD